MGLVVGAVLAEDGDEDALLMAEGTATKKNTTTKSGHNTFQFILIQVTHYIHYNQLHSFHDGK